MLNDLVGEKWNKKILFSSNFRKMYLLTKSTQIAIMSTHHIIMSTHHIMSNGIIYSQHLCFPITNIPISDERGIRLEHLAFSPNQVIWGLLPAHGFTI